MKRSAFFASTLCLTALFYSVLAASAQELVTNGTFETGNFSGWTVNDPSNFTLVATAAEFSHSPSSYANLGATGLVGSLSQALTTTSGQVYSLSFWLANDGAAPNSFDVLWNGSVIFSMPNAPVAPYTNYSVPGLIATGLSTTLEFRYRNDIDFFRLDDVSVLAVPEASTISFAFIGLGLFGFMAYRKAKSHRSVSSV